MLQGVDLLDGSVVPVDPVDRARAILAACEDLDADARAQLSVRAFQLGDGVLFDVWEQLRDAAALRVAALGAAWRGYDERFND